MDITIGRLVFYAFGAVLVSGFVYYVNLFIERHPFPESGACSINGGRATDAQDFIGSGTYGYG